jgi:hypothetical protein
MPIERALALETEDKDEMNYKIFSKISELEFATQVSANQQERIMREYVPNCV